MNAFAAVQALMRVEASTKHQSHTSISHFAAEASLAPLIQSFLKVYIPYYCDAEK